MNPILSQLFKQDVYADFQPDAFNEDITGWGGTEPIFERLILASKPKVIIEVGTWKGQSAITMGEVCLREKLDTAIICVDTWLGSEEHWETWLKDLKLSFGYPMLYRQFLANVMKHGLQEIITPLPISSLAGAALLFKLGIRADLIYIDANHVYDAVLADITKFYELLAPGGIMFGHDISLGPVADAVNRFTSKRTLNTQIHGDFWIINGQ